MGGYACDRSTVLHDSFHFIFIFPCAPTRVDLHPSFCHETVTAVQMWTSEFTQLLCFFWSCLRHLLLFTYVQCHCFRNREWHVCIFLCSFYTTQQICGISYILLQTGTLMSQKRWIYCIVDLVTFLRNKYVTVEGVKIGSRIWKKVKWDLLNKPRIHIQYFVDLRKSVR